MRTYSGNGGNLQAIIDEIKAGRLNAEISGVISNRPTAYGLERAKEAGINAVCQIMQASIHESLMTGRSNTVRLLAQTVLFCGLYAYLNTEFVDSFAGKLVNIHPSLLPVQRFECHQRYRQWRQGARR